MKRSLMLASALFLSSSVALGAASEWQGHGKMFDKDRQLISEYDLVVKIDEDGSGQRTTDVVVTSQGAVVYRETCMSQDSGESWSKTCGDATGGGYYFDYGLAQEYIRGADGVDRVTNIVFDSETSMRLTTTELKNGVAQKFHVDVLAKKPDSVMLKSPRR